MQGRSYETTYECHFLSDPCVLCHFYVADHKVIDTLGRRPELVVGRGEDLARGFYPHAVATLPPGVDGDVTCASPDVVRRSRSGVPERTTH